MLRVGDRAPRFEATLADGSQIDSTKILARHHLVLYFFPRDFTPGCTREACSFRDHRDEIARLGGQIYGISLDPPERHAEFVDKYRLPFPLISDTNGEIAAKFGVLRLGGWLLTRRATFVIDRTGMIRHCTHSELNMDLHVDEAIAALRELGTA